LSTKVLTVGQYGIPPKQQQQPGSGTLAATATAQGLCINDTITATIAGTGCWRLLFGGRGVVHSFWAAPAITCSEHAGVHRMNRGSGLHWAIGQLGSVN